MEFLVEMLLAPILKYFNPQVGLRVRGYAPVVMCLIRDPVQNKFLLTAPVAQDTIWAPPQKMMGAKESREEAAGRCLKLELGLERQTKFVRSVWVGKRQLPKARDQRDLPQSIAGLWNKDRRRMIGKGYYAALMHVREEERIIANKAEIAAYQWVTAEAFQEAIDTNDDDKQAIIQQAWDRLIGGHV